MSSVLPLPKQTINSMGFFSVANNTNVYCEEEVANIAELILLNIRKCFTAYSGNCVIVDKLNYTSNTTELSGIIMMRNLSLGEEEYTLEIDQDRITIQAATYAGFVYSYVTLLQLLPIDITPNTLNIECIKISDKPQFPWRGLILDEARHFFGKDEVIRLLDLLAGMKINKLQWHLSDDQGFRIQLKCYPELVKIGSKRNDTQIGGFYSDRFAGIGFGGYYTQGDIHEIVAYASSLAIDIIPSLDVPFHSTAMLASIPSLGCGDNKVAVATTFTSGQSAICASRDNTYTILENIINEMSSLFPSQYFHLGGNDFQPKRWDSCPECQQFMIDNNLSCARELLGYFLNRLNAIVKKNNKQTIVYSQAFSQNLDKDIILQYNSVNQLSQTVEAYQQGRLIIITPPTEYYFDYPNAFTPLKKVFSTLLPPREFTMGNENILGVSAALWTEWVYDREKLDVCLFPRMNALAEKSWSIGHNSSDYKGFLERCKQYEKRILDTGNVTYYRHYGRNISFVKRTRIRWQYLRNDQYTEVRENRK